MIDTLISFETAILLDDCFDISPLYWYHKQTKSLLCESDIELDSVNMEDTIEAPTQSLLQKYLREKYNCHIQVTHEAYINGINFNVQVLFYNPNVTDCWDDLSSGMYGDNGEFPTYEEALEFGLREALKRIKESKNRDEFKHRYNY